MTYHNGIYTGTMVLLFGMLFFGLTKLIKANDAKMEQQRAQVEALPPVEYRSYYMTMGNYRLNFFEVEGVRCISYAGNLECDFPDRP